MSNEPRFDKNYWTAIVLSTIVFVSYPYIVKKFFPPRPVATEAFRPATETPQAAQVLSAASSELAATVAAAAEPAASVVHYENELYDLKFSTRGGTLLQLDYRDAHSSTHSPAPLYETGPDGKGGFATTLLHEPEDLSKAVFRLNRHNDRAEVFEFVYEKAGEYRLIKTYHISSYRPVILLNVLFENLSGRERHFPLELEYRLTTEGMLPDKRMRVEGVVRQDKVRGEKLAKIEKKGFAAEGDIEWAGLLEKYFALLVKPDWKILGVAHAAEEGALVGRMRLEPVTVAAGARAEKKFFIFAGPQRYEALKETETGFHEIFSKGFFGLFKIWLLLALKFFHLFTHNYGWDIILLTLLLKGLFTPLTHISYESMRKMQALQPKLKNLQERYKNDPQKLNREMMELYRRNRVNPMGGCLPMLAQIPIFIAFYQVLSETVELNGAPFIFWIHDLAAPDQLIRTSFHLPFGGGLFSLNILPLLMIGSMVWQQKLTPQASSSPEQEKVMQIMPIMFGIFFYNMPSGLVLYWFVNNALTILHQTVIKRMGAVVLHHEDR